MTIDRATHIARAREVLDWLEEHEDYPLPLEFKPYDGAFDRYLWGSENIQKEDLAAAAREFGACEKTGDDNYFAVVKTFPSGASLVVKADRKKTCTAKVVGKKTIKQQVAVVKAVYEEQEVEVDDIEWDCGSVLRGASA